MTRHGPARAGHGENGPAGVGLPADWRSGPGRTGCPVYARNALVEKLVEPFEVAEIVAPLSSGPGAIASGSPWVLGEGWTAR